MSQVLFIGVLWYEKSWCCGVKKLQMAVTRVCVCVARSGMTWMGYGVTEYLFISYEGNIHIK